MVADKNLNLGLVMICGTAFMLLFIAFGTAQNLVTQAMKDMNFNNLGFYSLSVLYVISTVGSFLNASLVQRLTALRSMFYGARCYFFCVLGSLFPSTAKLVGSSVASMAIYILMAGVLLFRPTGLFGAQS